MFLKSMIVNRTETIGKHFMILMAIFCLLVSGCDSSSDGDDPNSGPKPIENSNYEGKNTRSTINKDNAKTFSTKSLIGKMVSDESDTYRSSHGSRQQGNRKKYPSLFDISSTIKNAVRQKKVDAATGSYSRAAVETKTDKKKGKNGGTATYEIEIDTDTGEISGKVTYDEYCNGESTWYGKADFSGRFNKDSDEIESFSMSTDSITIKTKSSTMKGEFSISMSLNEKSLAMSMDITDKLENRTHRIENYETVHTEKDTQTEFTINGRFYHFDDGYVEIKTPEPFVKKNTDSEYSSGILEIIGKNGEAGGPTKAKLTAISSIECQVEADTNGDGEYDYDSGYISWDELREDNSSDSENDNTDTETDTDTDNTSTDDKLMEINVDSCFTLSTATAEEGNCESEEDGDIYFWEGGNVDIHSNTEIFCPQEGEFTDLKSVPGDYSDCEWTSYIEGMNGLENTGLIVKDQSSENYYKMRIVENQLPEITFEYERIDEQ